jgi:hypothetical protein
MKDSNINFQEIREVEAVFFHVDEHDEVSSCFA